MIAVLPVDIQQGLDDWPYWGGNRSTPAFEHNVAGLLAATRQAGRTLIHVKHNSTNPVSPLRPGAPGNAFKPEAEPRDGELVLEKTVNSAFIGTGLEQRLRQMGVGQLVIFGMTAEHCVSTTVRMAGNLGFQTWLVGDATASFPARTQDGEVIDAATVHRVNLASLDGEFATVISTQEAVSLVNMAG